MWLFENQIHMRGRPGAVVPALRRLRRIKLFVCLAAIVSVLFFAQGMGVVRAASEQSVQQSEQSVRVSEQSIVESELPEPSAAVSGEAVTALASEPSAWAAADIRLAEKSGFVTEAIRENYTAPITREQFCALAIRLYELLSGRNPGIRNDPFVDTDDPNVLSAYRLGIVRGMSDTMFVPDMTITRQEICVMFVRCIDKALKGADVSYFKSHGFRDESLIAEWALPSIQYAYDNGIISGVGGTGNGEIPGNSSGANGDSSGANSDRSGASGTGGIGSGDAEAVEISPRENVTREQAAILAYRIFKDADSLIRFKLPAGHKYESKTVSSSVAAESPHSLIAYGYSPTWSSPQNGYLFQNGNGFTVVDVTSEGLVAEDYTVNMRRTSKREVPFDLPIFGAVYLGTDGKYYVLTGRNNQNERSGEEVMRLVRYSKTWKREAAVSIESSQSIVVIPFDAGCPRIADNGNTLEIYTSRERFTSSDGLNHQSNLAVSVDMRTMEVISQSGAFPWNHVSHSFDQYVMFDGREYIYVDHGDAYPRALILQTGNGRRVAEFYDIDGGTGDNYTGVSIGGAGVFGGNYIIVGNSVEQDEFGTDETRDIMLSVISRDGLKTQTTWLTDLGDKKTAYIPKLVKISADRMAVMWEEFSLTPIDDGYSEINYEDTKYLLIDGAGKPQGDAVSLPGLRLPNGVDPIWWRGSIIWYSVNPDSVTDSYYTSDYGENADGRDSADAPTDTELIFHSLTIN